MRIITINLPIHYLNAIETLTDYGLYESRSDAVRVALSEFLMKELKFSHDLDDDTFDMLIRNNLRDTQ